MPDYRRNRVAGATFFFTVDLRDRRSDLLVVEIGALRSAVQAARARCPFHILGGATRPHALLVDVAAG